MTSWAVIQWHGHAITAYGPFLSESDARHWIETESLFEDDCEIVELFASRAHTYFIPTTRKSHDR
jgi:hypothetical protein